MKHLTLLLILTSIFVANELIAQEKAIQIKGQLIDKIGRYPISGAKISILEENIQAITNKSGYFSMQSAKKGDKCLEMEWLGEKRTILFIPIVDSINNLGAILIDAPFSRPVLLKPINSSARYE